MKIDPIKWLNAIIFKDSIFLSDIKLRFINGAFWSALTLFFSQGIRLLSFIVIARIISQEEFGEIAMVQSTLGFMGVFAGSSLSLTATRYIARFREADPIRAGKIIGLTVVIVWVFGILISAVILIIAPTLADSILNRPDLAYLLRIGCFLTFFSALNASQSGIIAGFEKYKYDAVASLISGIFGFLLLVYGVIWYGIAGAIVGLTLLEFLRWLANFIALKAILKKVGIKTRIKDSYKEIHILWNFSVPTFIGVVLSSVTLWVTRVFLINIDNGYVHLAVYSAARRIVSAIQMSVNKLFDITLPIMSKLYSEHKYNEIMKIMNKIVKYGLIGLIVLIIPICLASKYIMLSYGEDYKNGGITLTLLLFMVLFASLSSIIGKGIVAIGRLWWNLLCTIIWGGIVVALSWILIPSLKEMGLAIAFLAGYIIHYINQVLLFNYSIKSLSNRSEDLGPER